MPNLSGNLPSYGCGLAQLSGFQSGAADLSSGINLRNIVTARNTKNGRPRDIPMNDDVREALAELCRDKKPDEYVFVSPKKKESCLRETKRGFHTACRLAGIEGLIWKDLRATFGTRLAEIGCDAFTIAQLLGHSDVRVTMRYVRTVEESKRAAVDAVQLNSRKNVHVLATWENGTFGVAIVSV